MMMTLLVGDRFAMLLQLTRILFWTLPKLHLL